MRVDETDDSLFGFWFKKSQEYYEREQSTRLVALIFAAMKPIFFGTAGYTNGIDFAVYLGNVLLKLS